MMDKNTSNGGLLNGIVSANPLLRLALGLCPALAVTTTALNGLGMGVATACTLVCTSIITFLLGRIVSEKGRIAVFLMVNAAFATVVQLVLKAGFPGLDAALGIYVPLIAVNCLLLSRAEFACDNGFGATFADAVGMGVGYICAMTVVGIVRELLGKGTLFGATVLPGSPVLLMALPAGGFLAVGLLMGIFNAIVGKKDKKEETPV